MMEYSVAIRTLGLNPEVLKRELTSIFAQSLAPSKVVIYIAHGYKIPDFRVAYEEYVYTAKGMVAQRALPYDEIATDLLLLLDDDVELAPDSVERLVAAMAEGKYDCVSADTFANHALPPRSKIYAALTNLTLPHLPGQFAFRLRGWGSFSYVSHPPRPVMDSQTAAAPCSLWRKSVLSTLRLQDELWLDSIGYAFSEDGLESYKLYANGGRLGVHFNAGVTNIDAKTSSGAYAVNSERFAIRAKASYLVWHRALISSEPSAAKRTLRTIAFWGKFLWCFPAHAIAAAGQRRPIIMWHYIKGTLQGVKATRENWYRDLPPYLHPHA